MSDSTLRVEELGFLDEAAISNIIAVLKPLWRGEGMRASEHERNARIALRTFLMRARQQ